MVRARGVQQLEMLFHRFRLLTLFLALSAGLLCRGGRFKDEKGALKTPHSKRGLLSMCNTGPNSNGSQ